MSGAFRLADVLGRYVERSGYTSGQLAGLSGVPKATIVNWLGGRVRKPRHWHDLIKLTAVLHLNESEATELLQCVGYPSIGELLVQADNGLDKDLLSFWADAVQRRCEQAPFQAIADLPYFVGREEELCALKEALLAGRHVAIYSLQGMGGVGKTALAAHVAYQLRPRFPDGVLWARLDTSDTLSILSTFADACGRDVSQYADLDSRSRVVRELLADKRALIILDNARSSQEVEPLLPPTGACAVVVTTRRHDLLATQGAHRFYLGPFSPEKHESLTLFAKILGPERVQKEAVALAEIADLLGHLPLAVAIAASRLAYEPDWSAYDFLVRVRQEKRRLNELAYEDQSVRLSFALSFEALLPDQQRFFSALGVFGGEDFGLEAVAYVADMALEDAQDHLRKLYSLSLVQPGRPRRYRLHPLLRDFTKEQMRHNVATERMVEYFTRYVQAHEMDYGVLEPETNNVYAALEMAFERGMKVALVQGANAFHHFLETRGLCKLAERHLSRAVQAARSMGDTVGLATTLLNLGKSAQFKGDYEGAEGYLQEGLAQTDQPVGLRAAGYLQWGQVLWHQGKREAARRKFEQALALAQTAQVWGSPATNSTKRPQAQIKRTGCRYRVESSRQVEAGSLRSLGNVSFDKCDFDGARIRYEQALSIFHEIGDQRGEGWTLSNLGSVCGRLGDYARAKTYYGRAMALFCEIGDRWSEGMVLNNLGNVAKDQGDYAEARAYFEHSLGIFCETGFQWGESEALNNLGVVSEGQGDYAAARVYYEQALHIKQEIGDRRGESKSLVCLSLLFHHLGDDKAAREYSQQALSITQRLSDRHVQAYALTFLGHALAGLGRRSTLCQCLVPQDWPEGRDAKLVEREAHKRLVEAADAYRQALILRCELGQSHLAKEPLAGLARVSLILGNLSQAQAHVEEILSHLETGDLDGTQEPFRVFLTCYHVLHIAQDPRAQDILTAAYNLLQTRAANIRDTKVRRSFLENVAAHRAIVEEFTSGGWDRKRRSQRWITPFVSPGQKC